MSTPGFKFTEEHLEKWFEPGTVIYRLASSENKSNDGDTLTFQAIDDGKDPEEGARHIQIDITNKDPAWTQQVEKMLVLSTDTVHVTVAQEGKPIPWDSDMRRYDIQSTDLGFAFLDLDKAWREKQPADLEFAFLAEAKAFEESDFMRMDLSANHVFERIGWPYHPFAQVAALLLETDPATGISQRLGLYKIDKERWDMASKSRREVYLC